MTDNKIGTHELMIGAALAAEQAEQGLRRAADSPRQDKLLALAAADSYSSLSAAYCLRAIAEHLMFPPLIIRDEAVADEVHRCESCLCCVGTYRNYRDQWLCTECSDGDACPRAEARKRKAAKATARVRREVDNAIAESNAAHGVPDLMTAHSISYGNIPEGGGVIVEGNGPVRVRIVAPDGLGRRTVRESIYRLAVPPGSTLADMLEPTIRSVTYQTSVPGVTVTLPDESSALATGYHVQPDPVGGGDSVTDLVIEMLNERRRHGVAKYGEELRTHNGRYALKDLQEELADALCYVTQAIAEQSDGRPHIGYADDEQFVVNWPDGRSTRHERKSH